MFGNIGNKIFGDVKGIDMYLAEAIANSSKGNTKYFDKEVFEQYKGLRVFLEEDQVMVIYSNNGDVKESIQKYNKYCNLSLDNIYYNYCILRSIIVCFVEVGFIDIKDADAYNCISRNITREMFSKYNNKNNDGISNIINTVLEIKYLVNKNYLGDEFLKRNKEFLKNFIDL